MGLWFGSGGSGFWRCWGGGGGGWTGLNGHNKTCFKVSDLQLSIAGRHHGPKACVRMRILHSEHPCFRVDRRRLVVAAWFLFLCFMYENNTVAL